MKYYLITIGLLIISIFVFLLTKNNFNKEDESLFFSEKNINLKAKFGENNLISFKIYNKGKDKVIIKQIYSSCSCSRPTINKRNILPLDSAVVNVVYRPGMIGTDMQIITVISDLNDQPKDFIIRANVTD